MRKLSTVLAGASLLLAPCSLLAAVDFQAPTLTVPADGGVFAAPFTVSGSQGITTFQFTVSWDPSIVQFQSFIENPTLAEGMGFNASSAVVGGVVGVNWSSGTPLSDWPADAPLFTINFLPIGAAGTDTGLLYGSSVIPIQITQGEVEVQDFTLSPGSITVVPEPINVALGTFAGLVLCVGAVRKYRNRKSA